SPPRRSSDLKLGHRDLLYVAGPPRSSANRERLSALNAFVDARPSMNLRSIRGGATMTEGYHVAEEVLQSGTTAALAFNDLVAFGMLTRLNEFGAAVPDGLSVAGFDRIQLSRFAVPSPTAVCHEALESGAVAWSLLRPRLQESGPLETTGDIEFEPRLIVGDSPGRV